MHKIKKKKKESLKKQQKYTIKVVSLFTHHLRLRLRVSMVLGLNGVSLVKVVTMV
jgi:hypothetical protein